MNSRGLAVMANQLEKEIAALAEEYAANADRNIDIEELLDEKEEELKRTEAEIIIQAKAEVL